MNIFVSNLSGESLVWANYLLCSRIALFMHWLNRNSERQFRRKVKLFKVEKKGSVRKNYSKSSSRKKKIKQLKNEILLNYNTVIFLTYYRRLHLTLCINLSAALFISFMQTAFQSPKLISLS